MNNAHTPEPWEVRERSEPYGNYVEIINEEGKVAVLPNRDLRRPHDYSVEADATRIVAAVNAVEGIPTEALEDGVVQELLAALEGMRGVYETDRRVPGWMDGFNETVREQVLPAIRKARE